MPKLLTICHVVRRNERPRFRQNKGRTTAQLLKAAEAKYPGITAKYRAALLRGW